MYDTILIPTDGSTHAVRAAEHGLYLARAFDATVHLLAAVDVQSAAGLFDAGGVDEAFVDRLEARGEEAIQAVRAVADDEDHVLTALERGTPWETILDYAEDHDVDLIAMGTQGRTGVRRYVAGSVTERVVRLGGVPVLTARATETRRLDGDYTDVLVPTDASDLSKAAVDHGLRIAERVDARVHAVSVVDVEAVGAGIEFLRRSDLRDRLEAEGERAVDDIASRAEDAGLEVRTEIREGSPSKALLAYAGEHGIDLIAMGTHGRSGLDRYLLGSTTERTIRRSDVPVLAVRPASTG